MGWMTGIQFLTEAMIFVFATMYRQNISRAHPASYAVGTGGSFPSSKLARHELDHTPPSSVRLRIHGVLPPLSHVFMQC